MRSARASPLLQWSADLALGHDDQILADPAQLGIVAPVSDRFASGTTRLLLRWADFEQQDRVDVVAEAGGVAYGENVEGGDTEIALSAAYRRRWSPTVALDLATLGAWFRRDEQPGGERVFDQDLYGADMRLGWATGKDWVFTGGAHYDWAAFPGRSLEAGESGEHETQGQGSVSLAAAKAIGTRDFLSFEVGYRDVTSNTPSAEYKGPLAVLRARLVLPFRVAASPVVAFGYRDFDHAADQDSTGTREDETWQFGLSLARQISSRVGIFLEGTYLNQTSNVEDFAFDQARASVGVVLQLASNRPNVETIAWNRRNRLTPLVTPGGVVFRIRAPDARAVSVVGGWNGWDATQDSLIGPNGEGVWEARIPLSPGIWRYAFVVDGVWTAPPDPPRVEPDGFGGLQGVLEVPGP